MQLIGIVLLLLVGLSGSRDYFGKKRAWPGRSPGEFIEGVEGCSLFLFVSPVSPANVVSPFAPCLSRHSNDLA